MQKFRPYPELHNQNVHFLQKPQVISMLGKIERHCLFQKNLYLGTTQHSHREEFSKIDMIERKKKKKEILDQHLYPSKNEQFRSHKRQRNLPINDKEVVIKDSRKTMKLLEENTREELRNIGLGNDFLEMTPKHRQQSKNRQIILHQ